jgi:hypothetical protein
MRLQSDINVETEFKHHFKDYDKVVELASQMFLNEKSDVGKFKTFTAE